MRSQCFIKRLFPTPTSPSVAIEVVVVGDLVLVMLWEVRRFINKPFPLPLTTSSIYTHQPAPLAMALHPAGGQFVCNVLWVDNVVQCIMGGQYNVPLGDNVRGG